MGFGEGNIHRVPTHFRLIFQPRCFECRVQVDIDLAQRAVAEVDEFVRLSRFDDQNISRLGFALLIADRPARAALDDIDDLVVIMLVESGTVAGIAHDKEERDAGTGVVGAHEIARHADEGKFRLTDDLHVRVGFAGINGGFRRVRQQAQRILCG